MPAYSNTTSPNSIARGDSANVWSSADGNLTTGATTQRVALTQNPDGGATKLSWRVAFGGNPGAVSLQLQVADSDADANYQSEGSPVTALNANNEARSEVAKIAAKFARILAGSVTTPQNASVDFSA